MSTFGGSCGGFLAWPDNPDFPGKYPWVRQREAPPQEHGCWCHISKKGARLDGPRRPRAPQEAISMLPAVAIATHRGRPPGLAHGTRLASCLADLGVSYNVSTSPRWSTKPAGARAQRPEGRGEGHGGQRIFPPAARTLCWQTRLATSSGLRPSLLAFHDLKQHRQLLVIFPHVLRSTQPSVTVVTKPMVPESPMDQNLNAPSRNSGICWSCTSIVTQKEYIQLAGHAPIQNH